MLELITNYIAHSTHVSDTTPLSGALCSLGNLPAKNEAAKPRFIFYERLFISNSSLFFAFIFNRYNCHLICNEL